ncbi:MAG: chromosome partitioning protein ParB [Myxococcota bacterium]
MIRFIHCNEIDGIRYTWDVRRLWDLAAGLPVEAVVVAELPGVDENCWFHAGEGPTVRNVVSHLKRILAADMERPILLNVDGTVMDGLHRVARALLEGRTTLPAVRFGSLPPAQSAEPQLPEGGDTNPAVK